ncbi:MAG: hypothetical protein ACYSVY_11130, partial [Planctomycetota bacterium]
ELMRKEIELHDEQNRVINRLFEEHLEALADLAKEREAARLENAERIKELEEELKEARQERDREAMREIREALRELTAGGGRLMEAHREFQAAVIEELDEEQASKFRTLARRVMFGRPERSDRFREIQVMRQALMALDLPPEQREATM